LAQLSFFSTDEFNLKLPQHLLEYIPGFYSEADSFTFLNTLMENTPWKQDVINMYGKLVKTPRLTAWYGDENSTYQFSGNKYSPLPWTNDLQKMRIKVEQAAGITFNSVLLNYYRDGNDSVAWHSDNEPELRRFPIIASLSLGEARKFDIRHKQDHSNKHSIVLENGSLLLMKAQLQQEWHHRLAKSTKYLKPRINLTFRMVYH
jgi:alkylated DNA repair dioxygenase AlkB